jgi:hypothetical protein
MLYKTTELKGSRLDLAVALAEGYKIGAAQPRTSAWILFPLSIPGSDYLASVGWNIAEEVWGVNIRRYCSEDRHAGPIIDREKIGTVHEEHDASGLRWTAFAGEDFGSARGDTRLEAAMRLRALQFHGHQVELPV